MIDEVATNLFLRLSRAEEADENKALAAQIVQVIFPIFFFWVRKAAKLEHNTGTPSLCIGSLASWYFHSLPLIVTPLSKALR